MFLMGGVRAAVGILLINYNVTANETEIWKWNTL